MLLIYICVVLVRTLAPHTQAPARNSRVIQMRTRCGVHDAMNRGHMKMKF